jgi:hypothetical protein
MENGDRGMVPSSSNLDAAPSLSKSKTFCSHRCQRLGGDVSGNAVSVYQYIHTYIHAIARDSKVRYV